jgi:peroxiredoxin
MQLVRFAAATFLLLGSALANPPGKGQSAPTAGRGSAQQEYEIAPDFTLNDVNGQAVSLYTLLDSGPVYMEFWDLPCVNCIAQLDALRPIYDTLAQAGLRIVAVSVDRPADAQRVKSFVTSKRWPYIVLLDGQQRVKRLFNCIIKPTAYLINMERQIVFTHIGYKKGDERKIRLEFMKWLPEQRLKPDSTGNDTGPRRPQK